MNTFNRKKNIQNITGFTLIELLVVIAIISILSTLILAGLDESRGRARNAARVRLTQEYINALETYNSVNNGYPNFGNAAGFDFKCIGSWPDDCFAGFSSDSGLNTALTSYIPGPPRNDQGGLAENLSGTVYACSEISGGVCDNYHLWWMLEGEDRDCPRGSQEFVGGEISGVTWCEFRSAGDYIVS